MLVVFLAATLSTYQPASSVITPQRVERMIDSCGARRAVNKLTKQDLNDTKTEFGKFDAVLDGVSSGDPQWLMLVTKIYAGTDAGAAESLRIAVAEALPKNPAGVLRLILRVQPERARLSWFRSSCGYPMIEPTDKEMRTYFKAAIPALQAVREPALQRAKKACLTVLMKAQETP